MQRLVLISMAWLLAGSGEARAQTCSFDSSTGVLSVATQGSGPTLRVSAGTIQLDGAACGGATTTTTSRIVVTGTDNDVDRITLIGIFAPGRNDVPETDSPEIEVEILGFNDPLDQLDVLGSNQAEVWRFTAGGLNLNDDLDEDVFPLPPSVLLRARGGNDVIDARAYAGPPAPHFLGGDGNDQITGSAIVDYIYGDAGDDVLLGRGGSDHIEDGLGDDVVRGGAGDDTFWGLETAGNGADDYRGNAGVDRIGYYSRAVGVTVTLDNVADDGEPGEGDNVHADVEDIDGGRGDDVLVGSSAANDIFGNNGDDEIHGGAGDDVLDGGFVGGADILMGEGGNDDLYGRDGEDFLAGGAGADYLDGSSGNDILDGGSGVDSYTGSIGDDIIYNSDAEAEIVDCGDGIDDPEPSGIDTFIGCENI